LQIAQGVTATPSLSRNSTSVASGCCLTQFRQTLAIDLAAAGSSVVAWDDVGAFMPV
jgi:hypothetical protein